jgi:DNA-binding NtrC family response regulator
MSNPHRPELADASVLVIDDEAVVCEGIRRVLEPEGTRVATAGSGAEALTHPALRTCTLAICDLMLPDLPGTELVRVLRDQRRRLPVILITGYATTPPAAFEPGDGPTDFLPKPFEASELIEAVRRVLDRIGAPAEARP